ncbi:MAG: amino acid adenylation domain-containing protein [Spirochaetales bacterium]|nr:amino acid adenylation domain-containing protein [Spirochaetales bacterium]
MNTYETRNQTDKKYTLTCIHKLFEDQVLAHPHNIALNFEDKNLTYKELNEYSNNLAHILIRYGAKPDGFVGIFAERSLELIVGILGIVKSGAAYVPLSTEYPLERIEFIMNDCKCGIVLTQSKYRDLFRKYSYINIIYLDEINTSSEDNHNPDVPVDINTLAYLIYTSGSTGRPKGVMIQHKGICNRLLWMKDEYRFTVGDALLHKTPIGFDVSVWEIFYPLISGAKLVIAKPGGHAYIKYLIRLINRTGVTFIHFIPPLLELFLSCLKEDDCLSLRIIVCGGEKWSFTLGQKCLKKLQVKLYNGYGPTEASVGVAYWLFDPDYAYQIVPIGRPISNTHLYIIDEYFNELEPGKTGELCISGICLSSGYLNNKELTGSKFVKNPFHAAGIEYEYLYKTGDMARYLDDGNIEFVGRIDNQVKIRGIRLELGEVENVLIKNENIAEAIVLCKQLNTWNKILVAFVVLNEKGITDAADIRKYLIPLLPEYMIPQEIRVIDGFPVNENGKIDKEILLKAI